MDIQNSEPSRWSSAQAYGLSVICLILGVVMGYLLHAPAAATVPNASIPSASQAANPNGPPVDAAKMAQMQQQVTPEQMKSMADKAAAPLLEKLKQNPNDADLLAQIAIMYGKGQQFDVSEQYFERAVKVRPSAEMYTDLASAYHYGGQEDKCIESLKHALEIDPKFANALLNLGILEMRVKGDNKGAIALWEKLIKTNPDNPHRAEIEQMIAKAKQSGSATAKP